MGGRNTGMREERGERKRGQREDEREREREKKKEKQWGKVTKRGRVGEKDRERKELLYCSISHYSHTLLHMYTIHVHVLGIVMWVRTIGSIAHTPSQLN